MIILKTSLWLINKSMITVMPTFIGNYFSRIYDVDLTTCIYTSLYFTLQSNENQCYFSSSWLTFYLSFFVHNIPQTHIGNFFLVSHICSINYGKCYMNTLYSYIPLYTPCIGDILVNSSHNYTFFSICVGSWLPCVRILCGGKGYIATWGVHVSPLINYRFIKLFCIYITIKIEIVIHSQYHLQYIMYMTSNISPLSVGPPATRLLMSSHPPFIDSCTKLVLCVKGYI
jgi:hypothetical protein